MRWLRLSSALAAAGLTVFSCGVPEYRFDGVGTGGASSDAAGDGGSGNVSGHGGGDGGPTCTDNTDCGAALPICEPSSGQCVECLPSDDPCPFGSHCDGQSCALGCSNDADCGADGGTLTCDLSKNQCVGCDGTTPCPPGSECDAGTCVPGCSSSSTCPTGFECCSSQCVNVATAIDHCGSCGTACTNANGGTSCVGGECTPVCDSGFGDCNTQPEDGCETDTTTTSNCGSCGTACSTANGTPSCTAQACEILCASGYADCDGNALANGCEVDLKTDTFNCGTCGTVCPAATPNCVNGSCVSSCAPGFGDCDTNPTNGCESNLAHDGQNCGSCGNACSGSQYCNGGGCASCPGGSADCDDDGSNACESQTASDPSNCGGCGQTCGAEGTCGCASSSCSGGTIYFSENFADNSAGWTLGSEWAIGPTQTSGGHEYGFPDPTQDHTTTSDNGVAGVVLGGNYSTGAHPASYLTSPVINLAAATGMVKLTFWRYLNCDYDPYVIETIDVYNGTTWVTIWTSQPVGDAITDSTWVRQEFDVTAYKGASFQVRFSHLVGGAPADPAWAMSGWNIDDLSLSSAVCN
jgi:hypothetical protein